MTGDKKEETITKESITDSENEESFSDEEEDNNQIYHDVNVYDHISSINTAYKELKAAQKNFDNELCRNRILMSRKRREYDSESFHKTRQIVRDEHNANVILTYTDVLWYVISLLFTHVKILFGDSYRYQNGRPVDVFSDTARILSWGFWVLSSIFWFVLTDEMQCYRSDFFHCVIVVICEVFSLALLTVSSVFMFGDMVLAH